MKTTIDKLIEENYLVIGRVDDSGMVGMIFNYVPSADGLLATRVEPRGPGDIIESVQVIADQATIRTWRQDFQQQTVEVNEEIEVIFFRPIR